MLQFGERAATQPMGQESALLAALGSVGVAVALGPPLARRLGIPPVLVYLLLGLLTGPAGLALVRPAEIAGAFTPALDTLVALIVFEGALAIDVVRLLRIRNVVRNLLTIGPLFTMVAAAAVAVALGLLPPPLAIVFGSMVVITGPTVITPLLRAVPLSDRLKTVMLGEAVLVDPIGAVLGVVVLSVVLTGIDAWSVATLPLTLLVGGAIGALGALVVIGIARVQSGMRPSEMTLLLLGVAVAMFGGAEHLVHHAGLMTMVVMGIVLSWQTFPHSQAVHAFQSDLTPILIASVYVLAAATVEPAGLRALWPDGVVLVLVLMFVVRPAMVWLCAMGSELEWRERLYVALVGPRGVVAAALAAFGGAAFGPAAGGARLTALVFLTILMTVGIQIGYAQRLARWLKVEAMHAIVAGGGPIGRRLSLQLQAAGHAVTIIERDAEVAAAARDEGFEVVVGDCTEIETLRLAGAERARTIVATTSSDETNLLCCQYVRTYGEEAAAFAFVSDADFLETFHLSRVQALDRADALADAMIGVIGRPVLQEALGTGDARVAIEVRVSRAWNGRTVGQLLLPEGVLVMLVRRDRAEIVPRGSTVVRTGDLLLLRGEPEPVSSARTRLSGVA